MIDKEVNIPTKDGAMSTFITHPVREGPFPVVILYMDGPGIREELRDMARRFGTAGYYAVLPNLYHRWGGKSFPTRDRDEKTMRDLLATIDRLTHAMVKSDTQGILEFLKNEQAASSGAKGCVGYCMSGRYILANLGNFPEEFAAGASLFGPKHVTDQPDSAHLLADRVKGELYFGFAEKDKWVPPNEIVQLGEILRANNVEHEIEMLMGADHAFVFPERPVYAKEQAERTWERIFALFERRLKGWPAKVAA
ncbi:MAG: dienelactone hydrolase family protein [Alphaproteobacteria bacterium]